ncbi:hydrogenase maturation protease [Clostridium sp.]|uniref:hydrogenase maturation protease n=1 Tax=Clostridium sp. TaxID=1506 RepID=UPI0032164B82
MIKVFGIGNILLCDDGIGVKVMEAIKGNIENYSGNVQVIIGETNNIYCLDQIEKDDIVIIVDSTYFSIEPGHVSTFTLDQCDSFIDYSRDIHSDSLLKILRREFREIRGYLIGIEIEKVDYSLELSRTLEDNFFNITEEVFKEIIRIVELTKS